MESLLHRLLGNKSGHSDGVMELAFTRGNVAV